MGDTKTFQLVLISACVFFTIVGVLIFSFAGGKPGDNTSLGPQVVIWGTEDAENFNKIIADINQEGTIVINAKYIQKDAETFNQDLLEALSTGKGPDIILASAENMLTYQNKIYVIPFDTLDQRTFKDSFIEEGELFTTQNGYSAVPFSVDPLVMYWNRDIFTAHDKASPPSKWGQVLSLVPELRDVSDDLTVFKSAISLGEYRNVANSKAILAALMLQSGTSITSLGYSTGEKKLNLSTTLGSSLNTGNMIPAVTALNFYTQFADPLTKEYTWNRSLSNSRDMFVSDDLAMYIGFGSEAPLIRSKNPNLNFDMALIPQSDSTNLPVTYGNLQGLAILASSQNKTGAFRAIQGLTGSTFLAEYTKTSGLPPVRRDLLSTIPGDAYSGVLYRSALYAHGFLDPEPMQTNTIFQNMVEAVLSGRSSAGDAVHDADNQFKLVTDDFNQKQLSDETE